MLLLLLQVPRLLLVDLGYWVDRWHGLLVPLTKATEAE